MADNPSASMHNKRPQLMSAQKMFRIETPLPNELEEHCSTLLSIVLSAFLHED